MQRGLWRVDPRCTKRNNCFTAEEGQNQKKQLCWTETHMFWWSKLKVAHKGKKVSLMACMCLVGCRHGYRSGFVFFSSLNHFLALNTYTAFHGPQRTSPPNITPFLFTWFLLFSSLETSPDRYHSRCRPHRDDALSMKSRQALSDSNENNSWP